MTCFLLLLLFQDSAEATFKKIEDVLAKADTIRITVKTSAVMSAGGREKKAEVDSTLLFKGSDKVRVTASINEGKSKPEVIRFVANGPKLLDPDGDIKDAPAGFRAKLLGVFCRLGGFAAAQGVGGGDEPMPVASKFKVASGEKGEGTLSFDLDFDGSTWKTTLVFDTKSHMILKVDVRLTPADPKSEGKAGKSSTIIETVKVETNVDIPDREFDLPEKKPAK